MDCSPQHRMLRSRGCGPALDPNLFLSLDLTPDLRTLAFLSPSISRPSPLSPLSSPSPPRPSRPPPAPLDARAQNPSPFSLSRPPPPSLSLSLDLRLRSSPLSASASAAALSRPPPPQQPSFGLRLRLCTQEDLEKKKAEYAEKLKNKIALIHKAAEEKRAMTEAKKGEDLLKAEETAAKYRATGLAPKTVFSRAVGCFGA